MDKLRFEALWNTNGHIGTIETIIHGEKFSTEWYDKKTIKSKLKKLKKRENHGNTRHN